MNLQLIIDNLGSPPVLFFFLGMIAVMIKSDLEIPQSISKFLSLYLLFSIGFSGGVELQHSGINAEVLLNLGLAIAMSVIVPVYTFFILKTRLDVYNAGAIAATYGSISAVTFITAVSFLADRQVEFDGYMIAAMAMMESPAIIIGVILIRFYTKETDNNGKGTNGIFKEALTNGSVVMILGSLIIGILSGTDGEAALKPFTKDIFKGVLTFFLLDMGLLAARRIRPLKQSGSFLIAFGIIVPLINATIGIALCHFFGIKTGDALLLTVLFASASYIAVPAAIRMAVPEANPGMYVPLSLAVTFPFNVILGIPLYFYCIQWLG
ncbi:MAG: sodium-dependent bicarbonate transport family permease [Bacteroidota bacterium]